MPLVEIIRGEKTSDEALARVVRLRAGHPQDADRRQRLAWILHLARHRHVHQRGHRACSARVSSPPPSSRQVMQAGYPAAPLQLSDELNLTLMQKIRKETAEAAKAEGKELPADPAGDVINTMVDKFDRKGKTRRRRLLRLRRRQAHRPVVRAARELRLHGTRRCRSRTSSSACCSSRRSRRRSASTKVCSTHHRRRQHRLHHGHRLPGLDRWRVTVHRRATKAARPAFVKRAEELAAKYGERFTPPASLK